MKKVIAILMLFVYNLSLSGSVLQLHYCSDNLESVSLSNNEQSCCCSSEDQDECMSDMPADNNSDNCCNNVEISLKTTLDNYINSNIVQIQKQLPVIFHLTAEHNFLFSAQQPEIQKTFFVDKAPPNGNWQNQPLYRIYGKIVYYG
ncbi:MAG: hypothetical protein LC111_01235 [Bacteroidia bacterium]|nr:hypothetical protein [Bacteroidia bacterium]